MKLLCKECSVQLTHKLTHLNNESSLSLEEKSALVPKGQYFISSGEYEPERKGDYLVNLSDLMNTQHTKNLSRLNGCCGLDGLDGVNLLCPNGHEIGIERSDCWMSHYAILSKEKVKKA